MKFDGERFIPEDSHSAELAVEHYQRYLSVVEAARGKTVVDAACGEGYGTSILAETAEFAFGIDLDMEAIRLAKSKYDCLRNASFCAASVSKLPFASGSIDMVISFETIEHIDQQEQEDFLCEIKRILRKGGTLILSTPDKSLYSDLHHFHNKFHIKEFYKDEFYHFLSSRFSHVKLFYQDVQAASILSADAVESLKVVYSKHANFGKYMIGICSDHKGNMELDIASIVYDLGNTNRKQLDRILELQHQVEKLSAWATHLDLLHRERHAEPEQGINSENNSDQTQEQLETAFKMLNRRENDIQNLTELYRNSQDRLNQVEEKLIAAEKELTNTASGFHRLQLEFQETQKELSKYKEMEQDWESIYRSYENDLKEQQNKLGALNERHNELRSAYEKTQTQLELAKRVSELRLKDVAALSHWVEEIESYVTMILKSLNWKVGNLTNRLMDKMLFKFDREQIAKQFEFTFSEYHSWRSQFIKESDAHQHQLCVSSQTGFNNKMENSKLTPTAIMRQALSRPDVLKTIFTLDKIKFHFNMAVTGEKLSKKMVDKWCTDFYNNYLSNSPGCQFYPLPQTPVGSVHYAFASQQPLVSIIIPVFNCWNYTECCIRSLFTNTESVEYEVILADDCSTDETTKASEYFKGITIIRNDRNLGFLKTCNRAASKARGEYLLFLNNDTVVKNGWLGALLRLIENDCSVGLVGSRLIYPDGKLQEAGGIIWSDASGWNYGRYDDPEKSEYNYVKEVDYVSGASLIIRKQLWDSIGGFDERYAPALYEDVDLAFEVRKRGLKVLYQPASEVIHYEGKSCGTDETKGTKRFQPINKKKFREKWEHVLDAEHFQNGHSVFLARDRSINKKTILVIDHYVPQFDKDAGSKSTLAYLKLFQKRGFNIKFMGDNFFKHEPYTSSLQQMGIEVLYGPWYARNWKSWLKQNLPSIQYVLLNRPHVAIKYIDYIRKNSNAKILYYGVDLHFLRETRRYRLEGNPAILESIEQWKKMELDILSKAHVIYYPSRVEIDEVLKLIPNINAKAIPLYICERNHKPETQSPENRSDLLFVGGFSHPPNIDAVMWFLKEIFPQIISQIPEIKFHVVGSNAPSSLQELGNSRVVIEGFLSDQDLVELYRKVRLAVVPLRYGAGVKGKIIEAITNNVPIVTTSIGAEGIPSANEILFIEDTAAGFADRIIDVYQNTGSLTQRIEHFESYLQTYFSEDAALKVLEQDIEFG